MQWSLSKTAMVAALCVVLAPTLIAAQPSAAQQESGTTTAAAVHAAHYDALPEVLATYDGGKFTKQELSATLRLRRPRGVEFMAPNDVISLPPERLRQVVSDLVFERILVEKALEEGIDKTTSGIREKLAQYEDEVFNRLYYERIFQPELEANREKMLKVVYERDKATKFTIPGFIRLAEIYLSTYKPYVVKAGDTLDRIAKQECGDAKAVSRILRDEPFHYYRKSPGAIAGAVDFVDVKPGEKLLVPLAADAVTSKEGLARQLQERASKGEDFNSLAQKYSEVPDAKKTEAFDLDPLMAPVIRKAVDKLSTGVVSEVLHSPHGFHIVKVLDKVETRTLSFEEVRDRIQLDPEEVRKAEENARKNLVERLRDKYHLDLNLDALRQDDFQGTNPLTASTWLARVGNDFVYTFDDFRQELLPYQKSWRGLSAQERIDFIKSSPKILKHLIKLESKSQGLEKDPQYRAEMDSKAVIDVTTAYLRKLESTLPPISEAEMREWYEKHLDQFTGTPKVKLREITKKVNILLPDKERAEAIEKAKKTLAEIRSKIHSVQDFEQMARRESDSIASRSRGGLIGVVPLGFRGDTFKAQIEKLQPGEISEPFLYGPEIMIVMVEEKTAAPVMPFEEVKSRIQRVLEEERRQKMREELKKRLFEEKHVQIHL